MYNEERAFKLVFPYGVLDCEVFQKVRDKFAVFHHLFWASRSVESFRGQDWRFATTPSEFDDEAPSLRR
jgi:hypothetical protein